MREILFRGKRLDTGEWVEGAFCPKNSEGDIPCIIVYNGTLAGWWFEVDPDTVGQFTGLLDKNGKRIFEGDVVRYDSRTGYVNFGTGCFCVQDSKSKSHPAIDMVMFQWDVTVIGNIHDNPELMEVPPDE